MATFKEVLIYLLAYFIPFSNMLACFNYSHGSFDAKIGPTLLFGFLCQAGSLASIKKNFFLNQYDRLESDISLWFHTSLISGISLAIYISYSGNSNVLSISLIA